MTEKRVIQISLPSLGDEEWQALREPIESGWLTQGPKVATFEKAFAAHHHVDHALATTSCTTALHLALAALGIGPGDEVIVPAFTWVATVNVVLYCGAVPVFVDVDPATCNMDPAGIAAALSKRTRAIIPVHLFGLCADMQRIRSEVPSDVKIIEDAACAAGARYKGAYAGSLGDVGAFSFHPRKSITTGEGGMLTTSDPDLAERANQMRNHGATISEEQRHHGPRPYLLPEFDVLGFNYRMTDLQAAVGIVQLGKLETFISERAKWAEYYRSELSSLSWLRCPTEPDDGEGGRHAWQAFVTRVDPDTAPAPRNEIMERLQSKGISTRPGTHAVHRLALYKQRYGFEDSDFPGALDCDMNTMALPLHNAMSPDDYQYVVETIKAL